MYRHLLLACGFFLAASSVLAQQEAIFEGLGDLPGGGVDSSMATAVSADGSTVVGHGTGDNGQEAFRWTTGGGIQGLGTLGGALSEAQAVSADGSAVIGWANNENNQAEAFRWEDGTMAGLGFLGSIAFTSLGFDVSADGSVVAGWSLGNPPSPQAFRWEDDVMVGLGDLSGDGLVSEGHGISADGAVVVGYGSTDTGPEAFRWEDGTMVGLGSLTGGAPNSWAEAVSADGAVVAGYSGSANGPEEAFRWTQAGGMVGLGDLDGGAFQSRALAVSADGATVVGWGTTTDGQEALIWTEEEGMRSLKVVLETDYGLDLTGWTLLSAEGVSGSGHVIVGYGINPDGDTEAWRAVLTSGGEPDIVVYPTELDFGDVAVGNEGSLSLTIRNDGDGILEVTDIASDDAVFTTSFSDTLTIFEGDSTFVQVTFAPTAVAVETGALTIVSNDPDVVTVALSGTGVPPPAIVVSPDSLAEDVQIGSTNVLPGAITITNEGQGPLSFSAAFIQDTNLNLPPTPEEVAAGWFGEEESVAADLWVASESPTTGGQDPVGPTESVYQLDDGTSEAALGLNGAGDVMWLNAFEVFDGFNTITSVSTVWGCEGCTGLPPAGAPATVLVYDDPNDDGNPGDALLLTAAETLVDAPGTNEFTTVAVEPTPVSGVFFVAVLYRHQAAEETPIPLDGNSQYQGASWIVGHNTPGEFDEENLASNSNPPIRVHNTGFIANVMVRADAVSNIVAVSPAAAEVAPGESLALDVHLDASTLEEGTYTGEVVISSNDPVNPASAVPVQMDVVAAPYPFALSPEAVEVEIDLADGDSTTTAPFTIANTTEIEQSFQIEVHGAVGNMPPQDVESIAYASRRGPNGMEFVSFSLEDPTNLTPIGPSPLVFGADFVLGNDTTLYALTGPPEPALVAFNVVTGETAEIAGVPPPADFIWAGLEGDPTDGKMYASSPDNLYVIDLETGELEHVGAYDGDYNMLAIAIDGNGQMYGHNNATHPESSRLVAIDKETAEVTDIGPTGFSTTFVQGMGFDLVSGELYMASCENLPEPETGCDPSLRLVDRETGASTIIAEWQRDDNLDGLAFSTTPYLFIDTPLLAGTLAPGGAVTVDANVDARNLLPETYEATLIVTSDVPGQPQQVIPVTLEVVNTIGDEMGPGEIAEGLGLPSPNPARGLATLSFVVRESQDVTVEVFDVTGRRIQTLFEGELVGGTREALTLDASALAAGVYVVRLVGEELVSTRRLTVLH